MECPRIERSPVSISGISIIVSCKTPIPDAKETGEKTRKDYLISI